MVIVRLHDRAQEFERLNVFSAERNLSLVVRYKLITGAWTSDSVQRELLSDF